MAFYYLLLGHLLGDFVLQTDKIADNKAKYWYWNALHAVLVTLCTAAFSIPFGNLTLVLVLLNGILHFALDYFKADIQKYFKVSGLVGFLTDQFLHVLVLYVISFTAITDNNSWLIKEFNLVWSIIILLFVTSFSAVLNRFVLDMVFTRTRGRFFEKWEKQIGSLTRLLMMISLYLSFAFSFLFILMLLAIPAAVLFQNKFKWNSRISPIYLASKLLLDIVVSVAGTCLILRI
jgi:uncharacterized membrane protein YqjE